MSIRRTTLDLKAQVTGPPTMSCSLQSSLLSSSYHCLRPEVKQLSLQFVASLRTLTSVRSGVEQADFSRSGKRGGVVRWEPVQNIHPVVRKHPVTGAEAPYVHRQFTRRIVGLKLEESDTILNFLYDHISKGTGNQARVKWSPNTVVLWDNRITAHSAIIDCKDSRERGHGARITPQAERPVPALYGLAYRLLSGYVITATKKREFVLALSGCLHPYTQ